MARLRKSYLRCYCFVKNGRKMLIYVFVNCAFAPVFALHWLPR